MKDFIERAEDFLRDYPEALVVAGFALVVFDLFQLYKSVELLIDAKSLHGMKQMARSEALGG